MAQKHAALASLCIAGAHCTDERLQTRGSGDSKSSGEPRVNAPQQCMRRQPAGVLGDVLRPFGNPFAIELFCIQL